MFRFTEYTGLPHFGIMHMFDGSNVHVQSKPYTLGSLDGNCLGDIATGAHDVWQLYRDVWLSG
jgi:hypothetical protein